jgi:hypothetical protein
MNGKKFYRKVEDFKCLNCGQFVKGNGYTNHCPNCLWSKHEDIFPGDRKSNCGGAMMPRSIIKKKGNFSLVHQCKKCGQMKENKIFKDDNFEVLLNLSKN